MENFELDKQRLQDVRNGIIGGRRCGKTTTFCLDLIELAALGHFFSEDSSNSPIWILSDRSEREQEFTVGCIVEMCDHFKIPFDRIGLHKFSIYGTEFQMRKSNESINMKGTFIEKSEVRHKTDKANVLITYNFK